MAEEALGTVSEGPAIPGCSKPLGHRNCHAMLSRGAPGDRGAATVPLVLISGRCGWGVCVGLEPGAELILQVSLESRRLPCRAHRGDDDSFSAVGSCLSQPKSTVGTSFTLHCCPHTHINTPRKALGWCKRGLGLEPPMAPWPPGVGFTLFLCLSSPSPFLSSLHLPPHQCLGLLSPLLTLTLWELRGSNCCRVENRHVNAFLP